MESVFALVDVFFVSRLGSEAIATVGLTESILALLYALAMGLSIGTTAMIARRTGEKDPDAAARVAVQTIALGVLVSLPIAVAGVVFAHPLLSLLGGSPWVVEKGFRYTQILLGGNVIILLLFLINAIFFRGVGDAAVSMRVLGLANALNILLCFWGLELPLAWLLTGPLELGPTGAFISISVAFSVFALLGAWVFRRGRWKQHRV